MPVRRTPIVLATLVVACGAPNTTVRPRFVDVTEAAGLPLLADRCLASADLDGDGDIDLLLAPLGNEGVFSGGLALYENDGHGRFRAHGIHVPLERISQCEAVDLVGDALPEIVVLGRFEDHADGALLLQRLADGSWADDGGALGMLVGDPPSTVGAGDLDGDGDTDLVFGSWGDAGNFTVGPCSATPGDYACEAHPPPPGVAPVLLRNEGGTFFPVHAFAEKGLANRIEVRDLDGDGRADVFVANDFGRNRLFRHTPDGFVDVLAGRGAAPYNHGMGAAFADFDGDGLLDIYVADAGPDQLWRGSREGPFTELAAPFGLAEPTRLHVGWSPRAADFDGDGRPDLLVPAVARVSKPEDLGRVLAHEMPSQFPSQADDVFLNRGGWFTRLRLPHRQQLPTISDALSAVADYDGDGATDAAIVIAPEAPEFRLLRFDRGSPAR